MLKKKHLIFSFVILVVTYLISFDLGNLDAIRQGTEGFYLQISKEMYNAKSYLTPLYLGNPHWSKPPLQFWLPFPIYNIIGSPTIYGARLSIILFSLFSISIFSWWSKKYLKVSAIATFIFFFSSICLLKYSRIFMMEIPLSFLTASSTLLYFDYRRKRSFYSLFFAIIFLSLSILIKGPVSFVMATGGIGVFELIRASQEKKLLITKPLIWALPALLLGSLWFVACYFKYGMEFIDYFFLRENLGKFSSKSYPLSNVFQGLVIFSLPWSLYIPTIIKGFKNLNNFQKEKVIFLLSNFFVCLVLWTIPNQRSHHYAVPAIPYFLLLILFCIDRTSPKNLLRRIPDYALVFFFFIILGVVGLSISFNEFTARPYYWLKICLFFIFTLSAIFHLIKQSKKLIGYLSIFLSLAALWNIVLPIFIFTYIPQKSIDIISTKQLIVVARKPYFIEEAINRRVIVSDPARIKDDIQNNPNSYYFVHHDVFFDKELSNYTKTLNSWKIWKRGRKASEIIRAIRTNDLSQLQEKVYLLKSKY